MKMKFHALKALLSGFLTVAHADAVNKSGTAYTPAFSVATTAGQTNGGTLFSDATRLVYSKEIEFKALPNMRFMQFAQTKAEGIKYTGDPDCSIPEQIAVQKLFLHQAAIDSIEVSESEVMNGIDEQINSWVSMIGSREKLEEYRKQSITQMRQQMHDDFKNQQLIQKMKQELVKDIKVSPAQVRKYFKDLPADSIPFVPTEVEVEILTMQPRIPLEEINRVKNQLPEFAVNRCKVVKFLQVVSLAQPFVSKSWQSFFQIYFHIRVCINSRSVI